MIVIAAAETVIETATGETAIAMRDGMVRAIRAATAVHAANSRVRIIAPGSQNAA
jgi:hypothetical protein